MAWRWLLSAFLASLAVALARAEAPGHSSSQKTVGYRAAAEVPLALPDGSAVQVLRASPGQTHDGTGSTRGVCPAVVKTHTDANFEGGNFVVQAGFAEQEIAAAQYVIPAGEFPIRIDLAEMIFATSEATQETVTHWSVLFWSGNPQTGQLVDVFSSDDVILPHLRLGPGTAGANIQFSVDPGDPDQIIIDAPTDGSNSFTVGYRIDQHHNQTQNPCFTAPPTCCNAFPTTDVSGLQQPTLNWLFGVNCGQFGCPPNGGWARFSNLASFCRPSGDWVIRATYTPTFCPGVGACCQSDGTCSAQTQTDCQSMGGTYQGDGSTCSPNPCPQPTGACCLNDGSCLDEVTEATCSGPGTTYQGHDSQCANVTCPEPLQACCFGSGPNSCLNETESDCIFIGGDPQGFGTECQANNSCPLGACCLPDGSCADTLSESDCLALDGTYQGHLSQCSGVTCPQPTGACCLSNGNCVVRTQFDCSIITGSQWAGPLTNCFDGNANGQADACESLGTPSATVTGVILRKTCDLTANLVGRVQNQDVTSEPRNGRIDHLRVAFNVAPGGPGTAPVTILEQTGCPPGAQAAYAPYSGSSTVSASIAGTELVLLFTPGLENARTYKFQLSGPPLTSVTGQAFEVRGLTGDVNSTGRVDALDRSVVIGAWTGAGFSCATDIDLSGSTNALDRSLVIGVWTGAQNCAP